MQEYYAYDPNDPPYWRERRRRLRGWRLVDGAMQEQTPDGRGWIWSEELASWLGADGPFLRLYERDGRRRLTEAEAVHAPLEIERVAREAAWAKLRELGIDPDTLL